MVKHTLKKLPKSTYEVLVNVTWDQIEKEYQKAFEEVQKETTVEGFRKGKAPKAVAEKHISKEDVYQKMIRAMLPAVYDEILKTEKLVPITSPRIELIKAKEKEDWEFKITFAEKPAINLGDYKKKIAEAKKTSKKEDIWVPGKEPEKKKEEEGKQQNLNVLLEALLKEAKCEVPDLLIEEELNHRLTALLEDIQKIGLTAEAYLKSKGTNMEELRKKFTKEIEDTYKIEFVLGEIAEQEHITVEPKDLEALFGRITDERERQSAQANAYFYASILRKQKTLEFLNSL